MDVALIEHTLGYRFRERSFLLQALTHCSYAQNKVTHSMERLEFLGDAVLDYLVTTHLCCLSRRVQCHEGGNGAEGEGEGEGDHHRPLLFHLEPGDVTNLRSSLVNNNTFARIAVRTGIYTELQVLVQHIKL